ncbi:DUF6731 family protein [Ureibacillus endophyticus]|uniref:DUF6731 family protein n=1 Tax=Ureibacillus endophyticus TaxID=1978490 RepID=UPI0020A20914|nr:DUF6731 family protein [Lysinibacillus endophyticus]MCP1144863.1 hypothetical protein [Lysinibacillus endophyticus]
MSKVKIVKFNFFQPIIKIGDTDNILDLTDVLERIRRNYQNGQGEFKIVYEYNGEPARLADLSVDPETGLYHLIFERLNYQVPSRTTLHGESTAVDLEDDEYIGLDVSVLYDPEDHVLMIQRNRDSLSPTGIESVLRTILDNQIHMMNGDFSLAVISDENIKHRALRQSAYRKIHFKVTGTKASDIINRLTNRQEDLGIDNVEIILNSKPQKSAVINEEYAKSLLEEYSEDVEVQKLRIRSRQTEESPVEAIDLFDYKLQSSCEFEFIEDRHLNPISVFIRMQEIYIGELKNVIRRVRGIVENV